MVFNRLVLKRIVAILIIRTADVHHGLLGDCQKYLRTVKFKGSGFWKTPIRKSVFRMGKERD